MGCDEENRAFMAKLEQERCDEENRAFMAKLEQERWSTWRKSQRSRRRWISRWEAMMPRTHRLCTVWNSCTFLRRRLRSCMKKATITDGGHYDASMLQQRTCVDTLPA